MTAAVVARTILQLAGGLTVATGAAFLLAELYLRRAGWRSADTDRKDHRA